jgi:SAM-dependent methyltransferase
MLDLGCGDSDYLARIVADSRLLSQGLAAYTGVDMSGPALAISAANMAAATGTGPGCRLTHVEHDMLGFAHDALAQGQRYDIVLASFSVRPGGPTWG